MKTDLQPTKSEILQEMCRLLSKIIGRPITTQAEVNKEIRRLGKLPKEQQDDITKKLLEVVRNNDNAKRADNL
jgi:hypothetical protein